MTEFFRKLLGILPVLREFFDYGSVVQSLTKEFKISEEDLLQPGGTHSVWFGSPDLQNLAQ